MTNYIAQKRQFGRLQVMMKDDKAVKGVMLQTILFENITKGLWHQKWFGWTVKQPIIYHNETKRHIISHATWNLKYPSFIEVKSDAQKWTWMASFFNF